MIFVQDGFDKELEVAGLSPEAYVTLRNLVDEDVLEVADTKYPLLEEVKYICNKLNEAKELPKEYSKYVTKWNGFSGLVRQTRVY